MGFQRLPNWMLSTSLHTAKLTFELLQPVTEGLSPELPSRWSGLLAAGSEEEGTEGQTVSFIY